MGTNNDLNSWQGRNSFLSGKLAVQDKTKGGAVLLACDPLSSDITLKLPILKGSDGLLSQNSGKLLADSPNWVNNLGFLAKTTTNARDTLALVQSDGNAITTTLPLRTSLSHATIAGIFEPKPVTSELSVLLSGAHWGYTGNGNNAGTLLRVGLINDGLPTPALAVMLAGGRELVLSSDCFSTPGSVTQPQYVLTSRGIASGTWPITEIGYIGADFTDASAIWAISATKLFAGRSADGIWQPYNFAVVGTTTDSTRGAGRFMQDRRNVSIMVDTGNRTSNAATFTCTIPFPGRVTSEYYVIGVTMDNAVQLTTAGLAQLQAGSNVASLFKDGSQAVWNAAAARKQVFGLNFTHEIGPAASFL